MSDQTPKSKPSNVYTALLAAQKSCKGVAKGGQVNYGDKYRYTGVEEMIAGTRDHLHKQGLVLIPLSPSLELTVRPNNAEGSKAFGSAMVDADGQLVPVVVLGWMLYHTESDTSIVYNLPWPVIEDRGRKMDKALATAMSSGEKYFLRDLLLVPRGIEKGDDMEERPDTKATVSPQRAVPKKKRRGKNEMALMNDLSRWANLKGKPAAEWQYALKRCLISSGVQDDGDATTMTEPRWEQVRNWLLEASVNADFQEATAQTSWTTEEEPEGIPI